MRQLPVDPNPPYGGKGTFRRVTATLPPEIYERLVQESARRKIAGEPNQLLSAILREAVTRHLQYLGGVDDDLAANPETGSQTE